MTTPLSHAAFKESVKWEGEDLSRDTNTPLYSFGHISVLAHANGGKYPEWSIFPHYIDAINRRVYKQEAAISGAVYTFVSRIANLPYTLGGNDSKHAAVQELFDACDEGNGLKSLIAKTVIDMCVNNNGAFWEIVAGGAANMPAIGSPSAINFLDSALCYRTGIPEFPVVYRNPRNGRLHKLHRTRVVSFSVMPQPDELGRNVGLSPVTRLMQHIQLMREITDYRASKVSGSFTKAIGWIQGIPPAVLSRFVQNSGMARSTSPVSDNVSTYINNIPFLSSLREIKAGLLNLASIPDGFILKDEWDIYIYLMSLCFGVDARELWPATQTGATKADAAVQHIKSRGKGFADVMQWLELAIVRFIIPDDVDFNFDFTDDEYDSQVAIKNNTIAQTYSALVDRSIINKKTAENHLVHHGILLEELIEEDEDMEEEETTPIVTPAIGTPLLPPTNPNPNGDNPDGESEEDEEEEGSVPVGVRFLASSP